MTDATYSNWCEDLCEAIENGGGDAYGLEINHVGRADKVEIAEAYVIFDIERHPHLFGRPSKGFLSSAFVPRICRYKFEKIQSY